MNKKFDKIKARNTYLDKYYNLFKSNFKWKGLDYRQEEYVMRKFWSEGTICSFKIKNIDEIAFAPWVRQSWDMYGLPEKVTLLNQYGSPLIPTTIQVVDKDVVIGYLQSNHKPLLEIVSWYVKRFVEIDSVIYTNLQLQKIPFMIRMDSTEKEKKLTNILDDILEDEVFVKVFGDKVDLVECINTNAPYLIDKLNNYKRSLESELLTYIGINNKGDAKIEQLQLAEVNSNNAEINSHDNDYETNLKDFCKRIREVLGVDIDVEVVQEKAVVMGQQHQQNGGKEIEEDEN